MEETGLVNGGRVATELMETLEHVKHLETFGCAILRGLVDPTALGSEFDACMKDAFVDASHFNEGAAGNQFRYVPMMCERTPVSLALVLRLSTLAAELLNAPVLPSRAKATTYRGSTKWHRDTELAVKSIGFLFYLESLDAQGGALRVLPGSHRTDFTSGLEDSVTDTDAIPGVAVPTVPGDAIAFDEHLYHASSGGVLRRQWRVDFVADLPGSDAELQQYFARQYSQDWDGGYNVDLYPSYGEHWRRLDVRWNARLNELGAYHAAEQEERFVRARHQEKSLL